MLSSSRLHAVHVITSCFGTTPGPLDTAMQVEARSRSADPSIRKFFSDQFAEGKLLSCEASCAKLMKLLLEDSYTSGAHVDVYDL